LLTGDRGKEMADHRRFTLATDIKVSERQWTTKQELNAFIKPLRRPVESPVDSGRRTVLTPNETS